MLARHLSTPTPVDTPVLKTNVLGLQYFSQLALSGFPCPDAGRVLLSWPLAFNETNKQHLPHLPARAAVLRYAPELPWKSVHDTRLTCDY